MEIYFNLQTIIKNFVNEKWIVNDYQYIILFIDNLTFLFNKCIKNNYLKIIKLSKNKIKVKRKDLFLLVKIGNYKILKIIINWNEINRTYRANELLNDMLEIEKNYCSD